MKSKKQLFKVLNELMPQTFRDVMELGLDHPNIHNETYGALSMIYVTMPWPAKLSCRTPAKMRLLRKYLEDMLIDRGFKVNRNYSNSRDFFLPIIEVQVSYFKGWHHDE